MNPTNINYEALRIPLQPREYKVGQLIASVEGEPAEFAVAAVTCDSVILVRRYGYEDTVGALLWRADQVAQERVLHPETFMDICKVQRAES